MAWLLMQSKNHLAHLPNFRIYLMHKQRKYLADEQYRVRVQKVEKMESEGISPWPQSRPTNATSAQVHHEFSDSIESREYEVAGRILTSRMHGKAGFVTIQDEAGKVQLYLRE